MRRYDALARHERAQHADSQIKVFNLGIVLLHRVQCHRCPDVDELGKGRRIAHHEAVFFQHVGHVPGGKQEEVSVIHIPMASGLSSSYSTAAMLAGDYDGKVVVIDNQRVSISLKQAVLDAKALVDAGKDLIEVRNTLTMTKDDASIYMMVDDLKYLKAGGRISPTTAAVGSMLHIKPILSVNGGSIESYDKVRGTKAAKKAILKALENDMVNKFHSEDINDYHLYTAAALRRDEAIAWNEEVQEHFGKRSHIEAIPLSIATHVGIGTFGACLAKRIKL